MRQRGIVTHIDASHIEVNVVKTSMCGENCAGCSGGCMPGTQTVQAQNETGKNLSIGDVVLLETETNKIIGAAAVVYLLPLVCLFLVYSLVGRYTQSELICAGAALASMLLCLLCLRIVDRFIKGKNALLVRITDILVQKGE